MAWGKKKTKDHTEDGGIDESLVKEEKPKLSYKEKRARVKEVKAGRKELRKDLKLNGVNGYADLEFYANDLDLNYPEGTKEAVGAGILSFLSKAGRMIAAGITLKSVLIALTVLLAVLFMIAYISEEKGHFTINLTADMMKEGFQLSDTADFANPATRLYAKEMQNANATSVYEINRNVGNVDGSHNGPGYMAQTFYLKNAGENPASYGYTLNLISETLNTGSATWVMFYEDDKQIMYARALDDGTPERLWGYPDAPFEECAFDAEAQYEYDNGKCRIITTPFVDNETVLQGYVAEIAPGEVKKYTCVAWLEGDDPDCNNSILGGHVGFNIQFDRLGEEKTDYFKGLYRTDYEQSYGGSTDYKTDTGTRSETGSARSTGDGAATIKEATGSQKNIEKTQTSGHEMTR